jgi:hypothetical protein
MSTALYTTLGIFILLVVTNDIHRSILHSRGRNGPLSDRLCRLIWLAARKVSSRLSRQRRHRLLNQIGPLLMPILIVVFFIMVLVGFALIYVPRMPAEFFIEGPAPRSPWFASIYFSGITMTTVGYGDVSPLSPEMRMVALLESASGFGFISLSITYLIAVYSALQQRSAAALSFYHHGGGAADAAELIVHHFVAGRFYGLEATLGTAARDLHVILELHIEHPIIHYFHPPQVYKGLPRILFMSLEICTLIRSCLDKEEYAEIYNHPEVLALDSSARHVMTEFIELLGLEKKGPLRMETHFEESRRWRARFEEAIGELEEAGIKTRPDKQGGWETYSARRGDWEAPLFHFAAYLGFDWDEVTGDRDRSEAVS